MGLTEADGARAQALGVLAALISTVLNSEYLHSSNDQTATLSSDDAAELKLSESAEAQKDTDRVPFPGEPDLEGETSGSAQHSRLTGVDPEQIPLKWRETAIERAFGRRRKRGDGTAMRVSTMTGRHCCCRWRSRFKTVAGRFGRNAGNQKERKVHTASNPNGVAQ